MVSIVKEGGFYYMKHHTRDKEKRRYLGKTIPKDIEQQKKTFLKEFYCKVWDGKTRKIIASYKKDTVGIPRSIKLKNFESFAISFTYNTQRIEGSSLTRADTINLLVHGVTSAKKSKIDAIETLKHYELFIRLVTSKKLERIRKKDVLKWHREIFDQTKIGEAGDIRHHRVGVITSNEVEFTPVPQIPKKLKEFFDWLNRYDKKANPVEFAALTHYKLVSIHPFADGNGRISRLVMNYVLFKYDCPLVQIESRDKRSYFKSLEKSQTNNNEMYFLKWFMKYYIKSNKRYL